MVYSKVRAVLAIALVIFGLAGAASADNLDRRVRIVNNTGYTIIHFYGSHTDANSWQEDILGNSVLPSGNSVTVNFDDGTGYCIFDLRAEFDDGDVLEKFGVNVCEIGTFTYN
ncbi:hypothetical protein [Sinisalibacter aestuarii]|uniref:Uncharacterized protein n=1 Tax=Sinisalibacter aestuarii TaxID=2949426 RepID=A0ABQ5LSU6_9RHOB|nr:hypothetical protein [Sinisalibacter aestuarii]GKY88069.1 hypothetical protein STA1M1_19380 [Sinisalibacter aestuarii]